jgi:hypothetical protein
MEKVFHSILAQQKPIPYLVGRADFTQKDWKKGFEKFAHFQSLQLFA